MRNERWVGALKSAYIGLFEVTNQHVLEERAGLIRVADVLEGFGRIPSYRAALSAWREWGTMGSRTSLGEDHLVTSRVLAAAIRMRM